MKALIMVILFFMCAFTPMGAQNNAPSISTLELKSDRLKAQDALECTYSNFSLELKSKESLQPFLSSSEYTTSQKGKINPLSPGTRPTRPIGTKPCTVNGNGDIRPQEQLKFEGKSDSVPKYK